jgi:hypothetical protein
MIQVAEPALRCAPETTRNASPASHALGRDLSMLLGWQHAILGEAFAIPVESMRLGWSRTWEAADPSNRCSNSRSSFPSFTSISYWRRSNVFPSWVS